MFRWIYRLADNVFLYGGSFDPDYDKQTQGLVTLPRNPNTYKERHDGKGGIRAATAQEMNDYDTEMKDSNALREFDDKKLTKAIVIWMAGKLLIPTATARDEILAIYKDL